MQDSHAVNKKPEPGRPQHETSSGGYRHHVDLYWDYMWKHVTPFPEAPNSPL